MADGSAPTTRFSATDPRFGWTKTTLPPAPMEKVCQLMATFCVDWLTVTVVDPVAITAPPDETTPPVGRLCACAAPATATEAVRPRSAKQPNWANAVAPDRVRRLAVVLRIGLPARWPPTTGN